MKIDDFKRLMNLVCDKESQDLDIYFNHPILGYVKVDILGFIKTDISKINFYGSDRLISGSNGTDINQVLEMKLF